MSDGIYEVDVMTEGLLQVFEFLAVKTREGYYSYESINPKSADQIRYTRFYFTDHRLALEFKMNFGGRDGSWVDQ